MLFPFQSSEIWDDYVEWVYSYNTAIRGCKEEGGTQEASGIVFLDLEQD